MKHIAVVEDEALMREELADMLRRADYAVTEITDFSDVTGQLLALAPDLVLLDLNLPEVSGFQICRDIKRRSALPVLVLTSRDQMRDEVHALELGADEYLTKPYRRERLLARIGNVLKRYEGRPNLLEGADFLLDRQTYTLYIHNRSVVLPPNQGKLLEALLMHGGQTVTKDDLSRALWGTTEFIDENALQVNLTRLKKTMAALGMCQQLVSVRGQNGGSKPSRPFWPHRTRHTNRRCAVCSPRARRRVHTCSAKRCARSSRPSHNCRRRWTTMRTTWSSGRTK